MKTKLTTIIALIFAALTIYVFLKPKTIEQQHAAAMRQHVYVSDMDQYGVEDYWISSLRGDCEDYALWMQERVGGQLLYVITESKDAHVVLDVNGQIVDSLSTQVYPRSLMRHKLVFEMTDEHVQQFLKARGLKVK